MAQNKRRRGDAESEEEDGSGSDAENSQAGRQSRNKRNRLSGNDVPSDDTPSLASDHESVDDNLDGVYTYQYTAPEHDASTAIEVFSSDSEDEGDEDEQDGLRTSEYVKTSMNRIQENTPSESGIIEEVSMSNFMCHARLTIPLGPLINFIIGHNGSGKSAILTALTICLGAKASVTNRGGKLRDFIKEGKDNAWVAVKIKNKGENSYQHDVYGDSIIVERHFSRSGSSSFKIKNSQGHQISSKKSDMENISDFFALQIDNPMNVLSQDDARQFLNHSTPSDKYKFFIRGTQLEQLDKDYTLMEQYLDECEAKNEARQDDVAVLGERKRKAEEKKKMMERTDTIQTQINETGWMFAWAQIEEQERILAGLDSQIARHDQNVQRARRVADDASTVFDEENNNHGANVGVIAELQDQLQPKKDIHQVIKDKFDDNKVHLTEFVATQRQIKTDLNHHKNQIVNIQRQIDAEHARIENANGPAHAQKLTELGNVRAAVPQHQERLREHRDTKPELERVVQEAERQLGALRSPMEQKQTELQHAQSLLNNLQRDQPDQMRAFHPSIHAVVRAIQSERRFRDKPIGPMGFHVRLMKPEWASIIETTFGGSLNSFVVTNKHDQAILSDLLRNNKCQSNILIGNPRYIDVSQNEPENDVDTILRVLEIDNDLVRNALIINQRIEQTVLIPRRSDANAYAQMRKKNVFAVMSHNENARGKGWRFDATRTGGNKTSPVQKWNGLIRMKTSLEEQIQLQQSAVRQIKQDIDQLQTQRRQREINLKEAKQAVVRHDQESKRLRDTHQRAQTRVQDLEDEISQYNTNDNGALEELQSQLEDEESELQTAKDSYADSIVQKDRLDESQRALKAEMDAAYVAVQELEAKIQKAQRGAERRERTRHEALLKKNHALGLLQEAEREKEDAVKQRDDLAAQIATDLVPQAEEVHSRIPVPEGMTTDQLDAKLHALIKERDRVQQSIGGSRDRIWAAWQMALDVFKRSNDDLNSMVYNAKLIKNSLLNRKGRWRKFRKLITSRAQFIFMYLLSERGFRGRILVNHRTKMLDISVEPDMTKASDKGRQTKTLSGGEKSFSTICLLLSIWEAMGSPIRCLDEFDVFMDSANRDISMKMMVQAARRAAGRQFILITPQAMTSVEGWHDVKIFRMSDPERGQTTLPFGE